MDTCCKPIEFVVTSDPKNLESVCARIRDFAEKAGADQKLLRHIELAVDEICSNVICHAYNGQRDQTYKVCAKVEEQKLVVDVIDHGISFSPSCIKKPKLEGCPTTRGIGGLGIHFVKKIADEIEYGKLPSGENRFRIYKQCSAS